MTLVLPRASACRSSPRAAARHRRAQPGRAAGCWRRRQMGASRAPTSATTSTSPAARGDILAIAESLVGDIAHGARRARDPLAAVAQPAAQQPRQHRAPLRRLQRLLPPVARRPNLVYSCAYFRTTTTRSTRRSCRSSTTSAGSCASPPASASSTSAAAGARCCSARRSATASRRPASRCRRTSSSTCAPRSPRAGLAGRVKVESARLPRPARRRPVRQDRQHRHVRARRRRAFPEVLRQDPARC